MLFMTFSIIRSCILALITKYWIWNHLKPSNHSYSGSTFLQCCSHVLLIWFGETINDLSYFMYLILALNAIQPFFFLKPRKINVSATYLGYQTGTRLSGHYARNMRLKEKIHTDLNVCNQCNFNGIQDLFCNEFLSWPFKGAPRRI